ncbi:hypothetical protein E2P64_07405 [Candidatus Bathyarchaeota archaeon]|nr:hypothetical protein E2P64_07405 [Candidatus Bathyarchaeota archaeon]
MKRIRSVNTALAISLMISLILMFLPFKDGLLLVNIGYPVQGGQGYAIIGTLQGGACGCYFSGVGDISGDGIDDFVIGASAHGAGRVYLFHGRLNTAWTNLTLADAQASIVGESDGDWFGRWTAELGDVNGDGYADFAVSAMMNDEAGSEAGKSYLFFGRSEDTWTIGTSATQANVTITGEAGGDRSGHGIYGIGDTNGDGYDDFILSAFWNDDGGTDAGQLYLFYGRPQNQWLSTYSAANANASWLGTTDDALAVDASGVGDINNDGFSDFAVGAFYNIGIVQRKVYLIFGSDSVNWSMNQPISQSNASLVGEFDPFLASIALSVDWISGAGDVNGDGFDDVLFGAYEEDVGAQQSGQAYLFFGRPTERWTHDMAFSTANASFVGLSANHYCGWCVDGVGDVNGDSLADIAISAPTRITFPARSDNTGHVYLFLGNSTGTWKINTSLAEADLIYTSEQVHSGFGFHIQGIGDVNNDNFNDFAIGAPDFDTTTTNIGKTYIILPNVQNGENGNGNGEGRFPWELLIIAGVVAVIVVVIILFYRRRRKP